MPEHAIPTTVEQVTPAWLTDALRGSGVLDGGTVTGFDAELIEIGRAHV